MEINDTLNLLDYIVKQIKNISKTNYALHLEHLKLSNVIGQALAMHTWYSILCEHTSQGLDK